MNKTCIGCGNEFVARSPRHRRCHPHCGRTFQESHPNRRSGPRDPVFVGLDGEGVTLNGVHQYVLFSVGDRSITNKEGLTCDEIFSFLWYEFKENPNATYVGFFLGYDFTMWLRSLPASRAEALLSPRGIENRKRNASGCNTTPFPVEYDGVWEFDLLAGKRFKLRQVESKSWMYVCDSGPFFQSSFLTAINPESWTEPICTSTEYETIRIGKERRNVAVLDSDMVRYNVTENRVLSSLMDNVHKGLRDGVGIHLKRNQWYGPGQAAQAWMDSINAPTAEAIQGAVPQYALKAAQDTYYGGWFEVFAHGHVDGITHEYDINSAYPAIIAKLPCLLHGSWAQGKGYPDEIPNGFAMVYGTAIGGVGKLGSMLHRQDSQTICRPDRSRGWFWLDEIVSAIRVGAVGRFQSERWITYRACPCPLPFAKIAHLYAKRLAVGKNSPSGKSLKLVYNSAYGKMAQSVGAPKYGCSIYASLITSGCRRMILDAIASHPNGIRDLLMVATDGVYFATPHPSLDVHPETLGKWDAATKNNLTIMMPGIYWDDKTRAYIREKLPPILRSRGIGAADLAKVVPTLDDLWASWTPEQPWPRVEIPVRFGFTTAKLAVARGKWGTAGRVDTESVRWLDSRPHGKREWTSARRVRGRWETSCRRVGDFLVVGNGEPKFLQLDTVPYRRSFGADYDLDTVTPEGPIGYTITDIFREEE